MKAPRYIPEVRCNTPLGNHEYTTTDDEDCSQGYVLKCKHCDERFHVVSETSMKKLLEYCNIDVQFKEKPITPNN